MLALVTCHISPPSIWYGKKWILGTWLPGWQLAVFQGPRLHECGPADAHGNAQPFCTWTNVSSGKNACFAIWPHVGTKFFDLSQHFLSMDGWPGDAIFFLWGQPLKIIHENSAKKRSSPLDFIFDTCASASSSHLLLVGEAEHMWLYPFCKDKCIFRKKTPVLQFGRVDTKFSNSSHHVSQKKVQPLGFYFWHLRLGLFKSLFWLVKLNMCVCTLLQGQLYFQQKKHVFCNLGARWHKILEFGPSCPISGWLAWWCDFFPVGQPLKIIRKYSVKKGPAPWILFLTPAPLPLEVTFLVGEGEHMWLYPFCKVI